jgi:hypothetical protein
MRALLLSLGLLLTGGVFLSCRPACDSKSCPTGCCSAAGVCEAGTTTLACGTSAAACQVCGAGTTCNLGLCGASGTGGGAGGTGGGSGGGTGGGSVGGGGGSSALTQLCTDYAESYINRAVRCGEVTTELGALYKPQYAAQCASSPPPGFKDGRSEIDQAAATACFTLFDTASCQVDVSGCGQDVIRGLVGLNGDCFDSTECQNAFFCDAATTCPGKCLSRVAAGQTPTALQECVKTAYLYQGVCTSFAALNQSCAPMGGSTDLQQCASPAYCAASQVCTALPLSPGAGDPCNGNIRCGLGLQCVGGTCRARASLNGSCDHVTGPDCKAGLSCSNGTCIVSLPAALGMACAMSAPSCLPGLFCDGTAPTGTCVAQRPANGTCTYMGEECASSLYCDATSTMMTGVCKPPGAVNDACSFAGSYLQCGDRLYCTATTTQMSGVCATPRGEGAACQQDAECLGFCTNQVCTRPSCVDPTP